MSEKMELEIAYNFLMCC